MLNEGWGDDPQQLLLDKERLLRIQVAERLGSGDLGLWDDLLNEARLTLWQVSQRRPDAPAAYLHAATGKRIVGLLQRGQWTGQPSQQGQPSVDPLRRADRDSLDDPTFTWATEAAEWIDTALLAYHEGQILAAIAALAPNHRAYVLLRFWGQWTPGEMAPVIGVKATNQARMWRDSIQPQLARELAHLAS